MMFDRKKIMVPTSGYLPAKERGSYIIDVAKRLGADVEVVHIRDPDTVIATTKEGEGRKALALFEEIGKEEGVNVSSYYVAGELVPTLVKFAKDHKVDLILFGSSSGSIIADWIRSDLMDISDIPVLIVPLDFSELI